MVISFIAIEPIKELDYDLKTNIKSYIKGWFLFDFFIM